MHTSTRVTAAVAACFLIFTSILSAETESPRLYPAEFVSEVSTMAEPLDLDTLIDASLLFSGADDSYLEMGRTRVRSLIGELNDFLSEEKSESLVAEQILGFMHRTVLEAYVENKTRMDELLELGYYNCVSSSVLFLILARSAGLDVMGVRTPDHAFCLVSTKDGDYDVETTNPFGFDPGSKKEFHDQFGELTGYTYVPPTSYHQRSKIGELELLSLIQHNRIVQLNQTQRYAEAVGLAVDAYVLAGNPRTFEEMTGAFVNMGLLYEMRYEFDEGIGFLKEIRDLYGEDDKLRRLRDEMAHNWVVTVIESGDIELAEIVTDGLFENGDLARKKWQDFKVTIYQTKAQSLSRSSGYLIALRHIEKGIDQFGQVSNLLNSLRIYRHNYEVEAHNSMVSAVNEGEFDKARQIIQEALEELPDSEVLDSDLSLLDEIISKQ